MSKTRKQLIEENADRYKGLNPGRAADKLSGLAVFKGKKRVSADEVVSVLGGEFFESKTPPKRSGGKTLGDFKKLYDKDTIVPRKIEAALKALNGGWEYESEFVGRSGVNYSDLGNYRDKYADHWLPVKKDGKRVWCGTVALAEQLRGMV